MSTDGDPETLDQYNRRREGEIIAERLKSAYNGLMCPECTGRLVDERSRYYGPSLSDGTTSRAGTGQRWIAMRIAVRCEDCNFESFRYL